MWKSFRLPTLLWATLLACATFLAACAGKDPQQLLHGEKSKKWVTEDEQTWTFNADGSYTQATSVDEQAGKYRLSEDGKTLNLTMATGEAPPFSISNLTEEQMVLTAGNGVELKFKAAH